MSREFEKEELDTLLEDEDLDSLLEEDDDFDAAIKEEYMKEAEEIERSLFPEGMPRNSVDSEEEIQASYEKLVALMKRKGIYREDAPANGAAEGNAAVDDILGDGTAANGVTADASEGCNTIAFVGNDLGCVSGANEAAGLRMAAQPEPARERTRRAVLRRFKMVRAAGVAVACLLGVFLVTMTSEANREYVLRTVKYLTGKGAYINIDNDENETPSRGEDEMRQLIEKEIGAKVPEIMYRPEGFQYYDYYLYERENTATVEYIYRDNIIALYICSGDNEATSKSFVLDGNEESKIYIEENNLEIVIEEFEDDGEEVNTCTAQWEKDGIFYQFSGRIEENIMREILATMAY